MAQFNGPTKVSTATPADFVKATNGNGYDFDCSYGDQCWDGFALFNWSAYGQGAPTGTGYARGCWETQRSWYEAHGYTLIYDKNQLQDGDWVIWGGTATGHVAMWYQGKAYGQNQKGNGGGYPFTLVSMSLNNFLGAFRPNIWKNLTPPAPAPSANANSGGSTVKKVVLPIGITLAALAAATGLTIPQILAGDPSNPNDDLPADTPIDQPLDNDTAAQAAENAEAALEATTGKTPSELAHDKCGDGCVAVTVVDWNNNDGTIWNICENHSTLGTADCVAKTIVDNQENIAITAAEHNLPGDGHWIFPGETIWVQP